MKKITPGIQLPYSNLRLKNNHIRFRIGVLKFSTSFVFRIYQYERRKGNCFKTEKAGF